MQFVNQGLHHVGVLLVQLEGHVVSVQRLLLVSQLPVDFAHRHENRCFFRADLFQ